MARAREGDARSVARLISLVEDASPALREVAAALAPHTGRARVIGLTGSPGVGKSTTTSMLVRALRGQGQRVGVLAVDPSSPFSGGALLGDRVRMQDHATDAGVFIRSMASRGHLGGLAAAAPQARAGAGRGRLRRGPGRDRRRRVRPRSRSPRSRTPPWCCWRPGWGTGSRPPRRASWRSPTSSWSTRPTGTAPTQTVRDLKAMLALGGRHSEPGAWRPPIV